MEEFIVSARKYRPVNFSSLIGQDNISQTLRNSILKGQLAHAYLFCGPRGVGKTSTARIFAKTINCLNPGKDMEPCGVCESCRSFDEGRSFSIHELDAASNNSVDDIRSLIEKVRIRPQIGKYSVYIIDEVHMLSSSAFNAFLKTLEEPPAHAIFILATTEKHKILPTILSRCQTYDFNRISIEDMIRNLEDIAAKENIRADRNALHIIAQKADGAMRDALTLFDQCVAFCGNDLKYEDVIRNLNVLDYEYYLKITDCILKGEHIQALLVFNEILEKGFNALHFMSGLSSHFRDLVVSKDPRTIKLLEIPDNVKARYAEQSSACTVPFLFNALAITNACEAGYKTASNQRLHIEFALMNLCRLGKGAAFANRETSIPGKATEKSPEKALAETEEVQERNQTENAGTGIAGTVKAKATVSQRFSIKAISKMAEQARNAGSGKEDNIGEDAISTENLHKVWIEMAKEEKAPRLSSTLEQNMPDLQEDGTTVHFYVSNSVQKTWMENNCLTRLQTYLQRHLNNRNIKLNIEVKESSSEGKPRLYMPNEKAKFLLNSSPELEELRKDLDLEIK